MGLREYHRKRDFGRTPEPEGREHDGKGARRFVVQKHAASRLHYDFRLEEAGVLKSWAVPKGPSLVPGERRLAVEVEDHPIEYGDFEGTIPKGEYGGGTVLLWDRGTWRPEGDVAEGLRRGRLAFELEGQKLHGGFTLVRMKGRGGRDADRNWLLLKSDDAHGSRSRDVVAEEPRSVTSGRDLDDIARSGGRVWHSRARATPSARRIAARRPPVVPADAPKASFPSDARMAKPTLVAEAPEGSEWIHEIKLDGYRVLCQVRDGRAALVTRGGHDWSDRFAAIARDAGTLGVSSAILDGEVVAVGADGRTSFQRLQGSMRAGSDPDLHLFAFDLLYLDGRDLRPLPLLERKRLLEKLVGKGHGRIRYSSHVEGGGGAFFRAACAAGVEGIVSKRRDAPYRAGRGRDWLKVKCLAEQELVIGGYTKPRGAREGIGAILVGHHEGGGLRYAGKVGTGFTDAMLRELAPRLRRLEVARSPFQPAPRIAGAHWVRPELVAQVRFTEWTDAGRLRHPSFQGLREDKPAREVVRESPRATSPAAAAPRRKSSDAGVVAGIRLTNPSKVLYPEQGISKLDLARYYEEVAGWILPHVTGRPLTLVRCPEGHAKHCFFQKHYNETTSAPILPVPLEEQDGTETSYLAIDGLPGLIGLVQLGTLEIHPWGSRVDDLERPDRLVFDLDPAPGLPWAAVVAAARAVRDRLGKLGLESWPKTTGGKGLHVVVPLVPGAAWPEAKEFCRDLAESLVRAQPDRYVSKASKAARTGKVFIDWLRNGRGATSVAAFSTRARPGAPVSLPLRWEELTRAAGPHTTSSVPARLARLRSDPWEGLWSCRQKLPRARERPRD